MMYTIMKIAELISIVLYALIGSMYWGPWLALTRSMASLTPEAFLPVVRQLSRNMAFIMTPLTPLALISMVPVLFLSFSKHPTTFYLTLGALILLAVTLLVTLLIEVPIVKQIETWTPASLPYNWEKLRDRWGSFHYLRVGPAIIGLALLVAGAVLNVH
jgi:uncharacterized membrane protein